MHVTYLDHMGDDLSVVNAARVSFHKKAEVFSEADSKLISYLAREGHWSPFTHTSISMRWKAPIFVARQLAKHQVGLSWNEVSRRYVNVTPELFFPSTYRKAAANVKQGSSDEPYETTGLKGDALKVAVQKCEDLVFLYEKLVEGGMCAEQARMFLPQNMYTEWVWTGSLYAWARVYKQRTDPHTQKETKDLVLTINTLCSKLFPVSWEALKET